MAAPQAGQSQISIYGGAGLALTGGEIEVAPGSTFLSLVGFGYELGLQYGYFFTDSSALIVLFDYANQPLNYQIDDGSTTLK